MELIARSKTIPGVGPSTTMTKMALSGGAVGSVRHTTLRTSAPLRSHPVAGEIHFHDPVLAHTPCGGVDALTRRWRRRIGAGAGFAGAKARQRRAALLQERAQQSRTLRRRTAVQDWQETRNRSQHRQGDAWVHAVKFFG